MKRLILLASVATIFLTGCQNTIEWEKKVQREMENKAIVGSLRKVEYDGHSYIIYREIAGSKHFGGITHDPDCGCEELEYYGCDVVKFYCNCEGNDSI